MQGRSSKSADEVRQCVPERPHRIARIDDGTPLAANELKMRYRMRDQQIRFATNALFFQEGDAPLYNKARYDEFRIDANGDSILTNLRDDGLTVLGRKGLEGEEVLGAAHCVVNLSPGLLT